MFQWKDRFPPADRRSMMQRFIMSPDSGKHWCNPYTYANRAGGPGCDSSNWVADGDAPKCDATSSSTPCTNAAYLDSNHSSIMWKAMPYGTENWNWVNYGYQDGGTAPTGINDGCDPAAYTCFMLADGSLARVPNGSIMDSYGVEILHLPLDLAELPVSRDQIQRIGLPALPPAHR